jgi:predicted phage tail protein
MKKLMTMMLGLSLVMGSTALFASPKAQDDTKKETKKKKKSKKKKPSKKEEQKG